MSNEGNTEVSISTGPPYAECPGCAEAPSREIRFSRRRLLASGARLGAAAGIATAFRGAFGAGVAAASTIKRTPLIKTSKLPVGAAYAFTDPSTKKPAYVLQPTKGAFLALSRVCPHMGCIVNFEARRLVCPCHGSEFSTTGKLEHGPATRGLTSIPVTLSDGEIYLES
jgi:nitrite reductase/ring-hydroxylating ferredoxin subunit